MHGRVLAKEVAEHIGEEVKLAGWVDARRDHGKLIFLDLRDTSGIVQMVITPDREFYKEVQKVRQEWVVKVKGAVKGRPAAMVNPNLATGTVEVNVTNFNLISQAQPLPIPVAGDGYDVDENMRIKYRYLDLRRPRLQKNIALRHEVARFIREYLYERDFVEIETPVLSKSTPEGSRDFLVPSRLQPGKFYALPQSPQQYKQLLMVAGFERYFQLAHAFRDEDLRADRAFEHTQLDLEMSFVEQQDVMQLIEGLMTALFERFGKKIYKKPFPVFDYKGAMRKFGADKFDLREDASGEAGQGKDPDVVALAWVINFPVFERDEKTGQLTYSHNPFTAPHPEDVPDLLAGKNLEKITSLQYDLVCNGLEIAGGGIRIHQPAVLEKVFEILGHSKEKIQTQFGHILEAFSYGVPPHGGCASGLDRLCRIIAGEDNIREVTAFPQTAGGTTAVMDAPSAVSEDQLSELHLKVIHPRGK